MQSRSDVRPASRFIAAVLSGLLCSMTIAPASAAPNTPPAKGAPAKAPAKAPTKAPAPAPKPAAPAAPKGAPAAAPKAGAAKPAQMNEADKKKAARKSYDEGMKKLEAKNYAGALADFQKADELMPAAAAKHKIALCYDGMGKTAEAITAFESFVAAANPEKQKEQIDSSTKRLAELKTTPAAVRVASEPPEASVSVDGQAQMGMTPMELKLAPGKHTVKVLAPGFESSEQQIEVKPGEKAPDLTFTLTKKPEAAPPPVVTPPPPMPATTTPPPAEPAAEQKSSSNIPAYVTLGVAGAGAIVGTIFGIKAMQDKKDFDDRPTTDKADSTERNALISDMAFGVAITLGVTGTVLLLSNSKAQPQQKGLVDTSKKTMHFSPYVTPHGAGAGALWRF